MIEFCKECKTFTQHDEFRMCIICNLRIEDEYYSGAKFSDVVCWLRDVVFIDQVHFNGEELEVSEIESVLYSYLEAKK